MSEPIDHHYLPVFYLRQWCNSEGRLFRYHRPHHRVVASSITPKSTGYEPSLYTLEDYPPEQRQVIEKQFMGPIVDDPASKALKILIERDRQKMTEEMRVAWTRFLMSMRLRDPHTLSEVTALARQIVKTNLSKPDQEYLQAKSDSDPPTLYEWVEKHAPHVIKNIGKAFLPGLIDHEKIGDHIINMQWSTFELSKSSVTLLTGDRPFITTEGLADTKCVLAFPLAPRFLFVATNGPEVAQRLVAIGETQMAEATNVNIVAQAQKHVYGDSARHLRFVENRLSSKL